jgi:regulatory protein
LNPSNPRAEDGEAEGCQESYAAALRLLARREHSRLELRHKLLVRNFTETAVESVVARLVDSGLLSDQRFAEVYARSRFERGYGPLRIRAELDERGVGAGLAERALADLCCPWVESAQRQRSKRFGRRLPGDFRDRAKQMRFLRQRGFTSDQIQAVFRVA